VESVEYVRKMVGTTEPKSALPGTIRGDYAHISYGYVDSGDDVFFFNLIHASADADEAAQELKLWFGDDELFSDDKPVHTTFTR
jgi:nucleoside-diphosphate kinase